MRQVFLVGSLLCLIATSSQAQVSPRSLRLDLPAQVMVTPSSERTLAMQLSELVGFSSLQVFKLGFEYDSALVEILDVRPGTALAGWPAGDILVEISPGLVSVTALTSIPVPVSGGEFLLVDIRMAGDLYDGERTRIRVVGSQPDEPILMLDDAGDPGTGIKAIAPDAELLVIDGLSCLAGDALGDGSFDAGDAIAILRIVTGLIVDPDAALRCGADADQDSDIDTGDAVVVLRRAVGLGRSATRGQLEPVVHVEPRTSGLVLRLAEADAVHGVQFQVATEAGAEIIDIRSAGLAASSVRVEADGSRFAMAAVDPLADGAGELEVFVDFAGAGLVRIIDLELFAADGTTLLRLDETDPIDPGPVVRRVGIGLGNTPNPFNPATTFWFEIPVAGRLVLDLFDIRGRHLATLLDESRPAGRSEFRFDSGSIDGGVLPSGVYFARLQTGRSSTVHRVTLLK